MESQPVSTTKKEQLKKNPLNKYFEGCIRMQASDVHLKPDDVPRFRVKGDLKKTQGDPLPADHLEECILGLLNEKQRDFFLSHGALDFAYDYGGTDRFRVNIFRDRGQVALAARRVNSKVPPFEGLNLPPIVLKIADQHQGLVLVTGVTGSGKSTTIASMLDKINRERACHIVTIEDPIEFIYQNQKALVSQREIGIDVPSFEDALRSLMREDPDVVLIGEMRDYITLNAGIRAAETGHLVFATLHSTDAYQTITRMLDLTPESERHMVRQALVGNLRSVISQRLLPSINPQFPRVPAVEILIINPAARKLIEEGREVDIPTVIKSSYGEGMVDYNECLRQLIQREFIDLKTAYHNSSNPEELKMVLKGIRSTAAGIIG